MWITGREASRIFEAEAGVGRQQSRRVLLADVAGPALRVGSHAALRRSPGPRRGRVARARPCRPARAEPGRGVRPAARPRRHDARPAPGTSGPRRSASCGTSGPLARFQVRVRIEEHGPMPFVATVCGYPVLLAELTDLPPVSPGRVRPELTEPTEPTDATQPGRDPGPRCSDGRRLVTSPGPPWLWLGAQPFLGRATRSRERPPFPCAGHPWRPGGRAVTPRAPGARPARPRRRRPAGDRGGSRRHR